MAAMISPREWVCSELDCEFPINDGASLFHYWEG